MIALNSGESDVYDWQMDNHVEIYIYYSVYIVLQVHLNILQYSQDNPSILRFSEGTLKISKKIPSTGVLVNIFYLLLLCTPVKTSLSISLQLFL